MQSQFQKPSQFRNPFHIVVQRFVNSFRWGLRARQG